MRGTSPSGLGHNWKGPRERAAKWRARGELSICVSGRAERSLGFKTKDVQRHQPDTGIYIYIHTHGRLILLRLEGKATERYVVYTATV